MVLEQLGIHTQRDKSGFLSTSNTKINSTDHRPTRETYTLKMSRQKHKRRSLWPWAKQTILRAQKRNPKRKNKLTHWISSKWTTSAFGPTPGSGSQPEPASAGVRGEAGRVTVVKSSSGGQTVGTVGLYRLGPFPHLVFSLILNVSNLLLSHL